MKRLYSFTVMLLIAASFLSCKKFIQQQEEKAIMNAITNGYWYVSQYKQNDSDITASFSGYLFKFDANGVVTGTKEDSSQKGVWVADINTRTITSGFPGATEPLSLLNAVWKIKDSQTDMVLANMTDTVNNTTNILQLRKQ